MNVLPYIPLLSDPAITRDASKIDSQKLLIRCAVVTAIAIAVIAALAFLYPSLPIITGLAFVPLTIGLLEIFRARFDLKPQETDNKPPLARKPA